MGKNWQHSNSTISIQNGGPGCMWGVLHILKYHHWRYIKKKLPSKKPVNGKNVMRVGNPENDIKASKSDRIWHHGSIGDDENPTVDGKMAQSTQAAKSSVKSRLKSLISEELYRMKGRHRRASSCPAQSALMRTDSIHHLEPSNEDPPSEITLNKKSPHAAKNLNDGSPTMADNTNFLAPSLLYPLVTNSSEDKILEDCSTEIDRMGKQLIANHSLFEGNSDSENQILAHTEELNMDTSTCQSKEVLDALDIINMNKEFFMKVLKDPGSPFAQHFHSQQALRCRRAYSKSLSFSSSSSSPLVEFWPRKLKPENDIIEFGMVEPKSKEYNRSQSMLSVPVEYQKVHPRKNQAVIKRFKNLKDKIKHVIRQSKNEKHRITMDGILHKIPRGHELPKVFKSKNHFMSRDDNDNDSPSSCESHNSTPSTYKTGSCCFSRTSSLSESLDRYCQLYESSCKGEAKRHYFEPLKLRIEYSPQRRASKPMRRLSSLPDLKSYFCYNEDSADAFPSSHVRNDADATMSTRSDFSDQSEAESHGKSDVQQNLDADTTKVDRDHQQGMEPVSNLKGDAKLDLISDDLEASYTKKDTELSESNSVSVPDNKYEDENISSMSSEEADLNLRISLPLPDEIECLEDQLAETIIKEITLVAENGIEKLEIPRKHIQIQVSAKGKAEFDYVKDILELSGFSKNELLGTWHADDQPMNPSLFDEVTGCMLHDPECSGNEEGYPCYNLLLFDLINEVLMEIYAKSYTYCPMPLSTLSHIRPMPVGHHVLEEVWKNISWYLGSAPEADQLLDYIVSRDLAKYDGWMNLQFDSECVGLEVEDIIFDDLIEEIIL